MSKNLMSLFSAFCSLVSVAIAQGEIWEPVSWRDHYKSTVEANSLKKVEGATNAWEAGAISMKLLAGDGSVRMKFPTNTDRNGANLRQV